MGNFAKKVFDKKVDNLKKASSSDKNVKKFAKGS